MQRSARSCDLFSLALSGWAAGHARLDSSATSPAPALRGRLHLPPPSWLKCSRSATAKRSPPHWIRMLVYFGEEIVQAAPPALSRMPTPSLASTRASSALTLIATAGAYGPGTNGWATCRRDRDLERAALIAPDMASRWTRLFTSTS